LGIAGAAAPWIAPHDPYQLSISQSDLPPMWVKATSVPGQASFPLGTDRYGRDVLSRLLYGTRTAFFLALASVSLAALLGALLGLIAGYAGSRVDGCILFFSDIVQSIPGIMFVVIIVLILRSLFSPSWLNGLITLVIGFTAISWTGLMRLVRIQSMVVRSLPYVEAAVGLGASPLQIITQHILPNVLHIILVWIINNIPAVILLEAVLGYIGVGITSAVDGGEFTVVSWGGMFFSGRSAVLRNPLMLLIPSLCILILSMSFFLLGDVINDSFRHDME
jgi:ABC-type dipeptide/oligopeptide/nickel transport system permease subunit